MRVDVKMTTDVPENFDLNPKSGKSENYSSKKSTSLVRAEGFVSRLPSPPKAERC